MIQNNLLCIKLRGQFICVYKLFIEKKRNKIELTIFIYTYDIYILKLTNYF